MSDNKPNSETDNSSTPPKDPTHADTQNQNESSTKDESNKPNKDESNKPNKDEPKNDDAGSKYPGPFGGIATDDIADFIQLKEQTGTAIDLDNMTQQEHVELAAECHAWLNAGKPEAVMPKFDKQDQAIESVTRCKHKGKEYLYYVTEDTEVPIGIELIPQYRVYKENGKKLVDKETVVDMKRRYTIPYTKTHAEELRDRCLIECENPKLYIVDANRHYAVHTPAKFVHDFDHLMDKASKGNIL